MSSDGQGEALLPEPSMTSMCEALRQLFYKPSCPPKPQKPLTMKIEPSLTIAYVYSLSFIS